MAGIGRRLLIGLLILVFIADSAFAQPFCQMLPTQDEVISCRLRVMAARMLCILDLIAPYIGLLILSLVAFNLWINAEEPQRRAWAKQTLWNMLLGFLIIIGFIWAVTVLDPEIDLDTMCELNFGAPPTPPEPPPVTLNAYIQSPLGNESYTINDNIPFEGLVTGGHGPYSYRWTANGEEIGSSQSFGKQGSDLGSGSFEIVLFVNDSENHHDDDNMTLNIGQPGQIVFAFDENEECTV